jgi:hypothetical protein
MIKLLFLMIFLLAGNYSLRADEVAGGDGEFMSDLDNAKNPFEDGLPKPIPIVAKPVDHPEEQKPAPVPKPVRLPHPPVKLPDLRLQGVIVGDDMHEAIINNQIVPLEGAIKGARLESVSKEGVELLYKGKKFFLKVD